MKREEKPFAISLFGYDRIQVADELEAIKEEYSEKINKVMAQIEKAKEENNLLKSKYNNLKDEADSKVFDEDFISYALKKADKYTPLVREAAEQEILTATNLGLESERIFNQKIEEFNNEIKETQSMLNELSSAIIKNNDVIDSKLQQFIEERLSASNFGTRELSFKNKDIDIKHLNIKEEQLVNKEVYLSINDCNIKSEDNVNPPMNVSEDVNFKEIEAENKQSNDNEDLPKEGKVVEFRKNEIEDPQKDIVVQKNSSNLDKSSIRNKYLIGKIAGENLLDNEGNIIVAKGTVITEESVMKAERVGKLAELIVNMTIPGTT